MSSLIEGFEYDIFISYRQKDNKHDGWVTEFVNNLKGELESTFKEEVSVYFDINPHDGLLETHDVDASLKEKLKCAILIPVISQTYCDAKSFAWEHEFKAFVEQASLDQYGLKIKLPGGNIASRVLPVQIHDLEADDKKLIENELGGFLRGIEFIYKEPGVNRPLNPGDDEKQNLNNTKYKNQINKVANAIKEIITGLKNQDTKGKETSTGLTEEKPVGRKNHRIKIITGIILVAVLIATGYFVVSKLVNSSEPIEKSIAILPFRNDSPDQQNAQFTNGTMEAILNNLCMIKDLRVIPRTSVEQYRNTTKSIAQIAKELGVNYILEGSGQKYGDDIKLTVQLFDVIKDKHIWASPYERKFKDIFIIQSEIAQTIGTEIKAIITPEEMQLIEKIPTSSLSAYDLYLKANEYQKKYSITHDLGSYQAAVSLYRASLEMDSAFAKAYIGLAKAYQDRYYWPEFFKENFLDSCLVLVNIALSIDDKLDEAYYIKGEYYRQNGNIEKAMENYDKTLIINPNFYKAYTTKGNLFSGVLSDNVKGLENYNKALMLVSGEERPSLLRTIGARYADLGFMEKAKKYFKEALALDGDQTSYLNRLVWMEFNLENYEESLKLIKRIHEIDSTSWLYNLHFYLYPSGHDDEAFMHARKIIERSKKSGVPEFYQMHRIGYIYYKMGKYKEADEYFKQQIRYTEESIKLERFYSQSKDAQYDLAATYAFLGDKEKAYRHLDEFNTMNYYGLGIISFVKNDPLFSSIRNEERFKKILQNMEAKYQAEHERVRKWMEENI